MSWHKVCCKPIISNLDSADIYFFQQQETRSETLSLTMLHVKHSWYSIFKWHSWFHVATVVSVLPMSAHSHVGNIRCIVILQILQFLNMDHLKMSCYVVAGSFIETTNAMKWKSTHDHGAVCVYLAHLPLANIPAGQHCQSQGHLCHFK